MAGPALVAVAAWCIYCWDRTGDPLVFLTTKSRWQEITFVGLFEGHVKWSVLPARACWRSARSRCWSCSASGCRVSWLVFGALYLIPSLQLGMVGVGRYANECFPPFVGVGQMLERWSTRVRALYFAASTVGLVLFAVVAARYDLVP